MNKSTKTLLNTCTQPILGTLLIGLGLIAGTNIAQAADIVCRGSFDNTEFAAYYGEIGFGRMELTRPNGRTVEIPLKFVRRNNQGQSIFRGTNPNRPSDVFEVIAPSRVEDGSTIRVRYNGNPSTGTCSRTSDSSNNPSDSSTPTEGSFSGKGRASGSVFGGGKQADASLNFNRGNFSLSLSVPPGTGTQVNYNGTFNRIHGNNPDNPNTFVLQGRVEGFASSINGLRVVNTSGTCRIEVSDGRITSTSCNTNARGSSTQFRGMSQF